MKTRNPIMHLSDLMSGLGTGERVGTASQASADIARPKKAPTGIPAIGGSHSGVGRLQKAGMRIK